MQPKFPANLDRMLGQQARPILQQPQQVAVMQILLRWADDTPVVDDGQPRSLTVPVGQPLPDRDDVLRMPGRETELTVLRRLWDWWTQPGVMLLVLVVQDATPRSVTWEDMAPMDNGPLMGDI